MSVARFTVLGSWYRHSKADIEHLEREFEDVLRGLKFRQAVTIPLNDGNFLLIVFGEEKTEGGE